MQKSTIVFVLIASLLSVLVSVSASREDPLKTTNKSNPSSADDSIIKNAGDPVRNKDLPSSQWKTLKRSKYLTYLFRKYGSGGLITFEGLEHMMHNLGLGGLEFNPGHEIEEHHPDGYRLYEDSLKDVEKPLLINLETSTEKATKRVVTIEIEDDGDSEEIVVKQTTPLDHHSHIKYDQASYKLKADETDEAAQEKTRFISMHDPKHQKDHHHTISRMSPGTMSCLSPGSMIRLLLQHKLGYLYKTEKHSKQHRRHVNHYQYDEDDLLDIDVNALEITPTDFSEIICPALLTQVERAECVKKVDPTGMDGNIKSEKKLFQFAWLYATISILIISMCGLVGVAIVPLTKSSSYNYILMFLVAVAVGTLAGDALMHLLPHALTPHLDHGDDTLPTDHKNNEAVFLCAFAFLAAIFMFILEALLPILLTGNNRGHGHAHHHHHSPPKAGRTRRSSSIIHEEMTLEPGKIPERDQEADLNINMSDDHNGEKKVEGAPLSPIAFMVIIGDGLHNITDGLAIGAAFAYDPITGMATALAVLCHELPHELGDFALLLKTGMSIKRALILNVISSVLSLFGMAFGLVIAGIHTSLVRWIYAATAGTFLYIAMADLIPEMSREPEGKTMKSVLCQVSGILIGGLIMLTIALNEDRLRILFE